MIFVNQPYIITVNESGQIGSKIELFIWNGATEPSTPNYTFTKDAPSSTDLANHYNISPFIAEFIQFGINETSTFAVLDTQYYANFRVKTYKNVAGTYTLVSNTKDSAMFGQPFKGLVNFGGLLRETTYNTLGDCNIEGCDTISVTYTLVGEEPVTVEVESDITIDGKPQYHWNDWSLFYEVGDAWRLESIENVEARLTEDTPCPFGVFTIEEGSIFEAFEVQPANVNKQLIVFKANTTNKTIRYTDVVTGATFNEVLTPVTLFTDSLFVVNASRYANGTKVELLNNSDEVVYTYNFIPKCECTYEPIKVQYLNNYGALFTVWFYKASKDTFSVENSEFKAFQEVVGSYYDGKQRTTYNTIGREKITVNSDWVAEDFKNVITDILMSEYTLVNDRYALIESKSIELQKNINNDLINYQLTFNYSNDYSR
jgi:hypothetical protein